MHIDLNGKSAIVTGGASNIGRAISLQLAASGANVVIFDRDGEQADQTCKIYPDRMSYTELDLLDDAAMEAAVAKVAENNGIDILVSCAGWVNTTPFMEKEPGEMTLELELNLHAPIGLVRHILPSMVEKENGRIVFISSEAARGGERGQAVYSAAKAGLLGFMKTLSREVGRSGVTVNAVTPAMTVPSDTDEVGKQSMQQVRNRPPELMKKILRSYPVGRVGKGSDIASAVTFLCSDQAEFITGQTLPVNGGFLTI